MSLNPVDSAFTISTSSSSAKSSAFAHKTDSIRLIAIGNDAYVSVGSEPTAGPTNFLVTVGEPEVISLGHVKSHGVAGITTGSTTIIDFPEGTGAPFFVGQKVSLTVTDPQNRHFEFTDKPVASINNTANVGGFFGTRLVVTHSYGAIAGVHTAYVDGPSQTAELRDVIHISALAKPNGHGLAATGAVHFQQVQVTSGA